MNKKKHSPHLILIAIVCLVSISALGGAASAGTFKDRIGAAHPWSVDRAHTLVWEGAPYIPFAVVFEPRYLAVEQTDDNLEDDEADLDAFKLAGVTSIVVRSPKGITSAPPEAFQRFIDLLETYEITYGIDLYDPPYAPLSGYEVQPDINRVDGVRGSGMLTRSLPGAKSALYVLCDAATAAVKGIGPAAVDGVEARVQVALRGDAEHVLLLYPQKVLSAGDSGGTPDIWTDYDRHRDRLTSYFSRVKFGKGLRFFIDPFSDDFSISGEAESIIPTSPSFRLEYAAWLSRKYREPRELSLLWGIQQHDMESYEEAARLIPLWKDRRGVPAVYDDGTARSYTADVTVSKIWSDFQEFRTESVRTYLNAMADVLKRQAADVPVVYTATGLQPIYRSAGSSGFDGLAVLAASGRDQLISGAGQVLSMAENASAGGCILARLDPVAAKYGKKEDLFSAINTLRDLGAKGYLLDVTKETSITGAELVTWLAEYAGLSASDRYFASYRPRTIFYPAGAAGASIRRLGNGIWWLPTLAQGSTLSLGPSLLGYAVAGENGQTEAYIYSIKGTQTFHLVAFNAVTVIDASGEQMEVIPKKDRVEITAGPDPIIIRGIPVDQMLPVEVVADAVQELEKAIANAEAKRMDTSTYRQNLARAREFLAKNNLSLALGIARDMTEELNHRLRGLDVHPSAGGISSNG